MGQGPAIRLPHLFVDCAVAMNLRVPRPFGPLLPLSIRPHDESIRMRTFLNHSG
jgi:hypothetical protein